VYAEADLAIRQFHNKPSKQREGASRAA
jgi:hypothetical protein